MDYNAYIEENTLRCEASCRGGGIEIDCSELFPKLAEKYNEQLLMSAYQNYLGGGLLGSVQSSVNFDRSELSKKDQKKFDEVQEALKKYFHSLTNHVGNEWEETTFEEDQLRPESAY